MADEKNTNKSNFWRNNLYASAAIIGIAVVGFTVLTAGNGTGLGDSIATMLMASVSMGFAGTALAIQGVVSGLYKMFSNNKAASAPSIAEEKSKDLAVQEGKSIDTPAITLPSVTVQENKPTVTPIKDEPSLVKPEKTNIVAEGSKQAEPPVRQMSSKAKVINNFENVLGELTGKHAKKVADNRESKSSSTGRE
jgi:hypothetical protein